ncbi:MAG: multidrug efflux MFS transporter, partial [Xanthomonas euvesicatoria]|nr:multidrug efflux MFS transporter [Xanthomonas euvesicatoria]NEL30486.1 multidrug efflux MFS transporter [Xanthomonas euvesicatoria]
RFGYRNSLIGNGVLASLGYMVCAFFRPDWPPALMFGLLLCCGAFMSFQFAAYNTIAYENVPAARMSRASSLYTTLQQLMLSVGVCAGAMILNLAMLAGGHATPHQSDFSLAFCIVSLISLSATWWHVRFDKHAGQEMSGHRA